ncbi:hypothetical protein FB451DRAFT_1167980 [Mycena latifolia]|nr:hypothetical protein FB451DRAFT_1167980 [Mycena latifolia]
MENEVPDSQTPHPARIEDETRAALRELQLAAVEREAQIARLTLRLQHALDDIKRARAETTAMEVQLQEAEGQLAALRVKYDRAKGWWVHFNADRKRKNDSEESGAREEHESSPSRSPEQACSSDSSPDPQRSPILHVPTQAQADRDPRKRIKLDTTAPSVRPCTPALAAVSAPVSRSTSSAGTAHRPRTQASAPVSASASVVGNPSPANLSASTAAPSSAPPPSSATPRPLSIPISNPNPLLLPSRPKTPSIPTATPQAGNAHRAAATPMSILKPTPTPPSILKPTQERRDQPQQASAFQSGTFQLQRPNPNAKGNANGNASRSANLNSGGANGGVGEVVRKWGGVRYAELYDTIRESIQLGPGGRSIRPVESIEVQYHFPAESSKQNANGLPLLLSEGLPAPRSDEARRLGYEPTTRDTVARRGDGDVDFSG